MAPRKPNKTWALNDWPGVAAFAASLPGAELSTHYGKPAVKVNGRPIVGVSREDDSFVVHINQTTKNIWLSAHPEIFWQTPHYDGWNCLLARFVSGDGSPIRQAVVASWKWAAELGPPKTRKSR